MLQRPINFDRIADRIRILGADRAIAAVLLLAYAFTFVGLSRFLPLQPATWLTFLALLITPGYLLASLITRRLNLDSLQRLALAFPFGVAVLAVPGLLALIQNMTVDDLANGWRLTSFIVVAVWFARELSAGFPDTWSRPATSEGWSRTEQLLLLLLLLAFVIMLPALTAYRVDGDLLTFLTKVSDALDGQRMNVTEPMFGTDLGPGVRSAFSQFLPLWSLWSFFSGLDPLPLTGYGTRSLFALWALFSAYMLGKEAGDGDRRFGLFTAVLQSLIYLAAIFFRGDSVSIFFFERTNADKFTISVTMLPVAIGLAIHFLRERNRVAWLASFIVAFAISTIHPLVSAMLALGLAAFGGLHLLLNMRRWSAWRRVLALAPIAGVAMFLPIVLLLMSRGSEPLAPTYPSSFDGWSIGIERTPVLPFVSIPNLDVYGPLPDLGNLTAQEADTDASPFLVWRYAFNMRRQRLIVFDLNRYIADPGLFVEPPYFLAILLLPLLVWSLQKSIGAQYILGAGLGILYVMFNPILTPIVGSLVVPWLLWRFLWMFPYALILAFALYPLPGIVARFVSQRWPHARASGWLQSYGGIGLLLALGLLLSPQIYQNVRNVRLGSAAPDIFSAPQALLARLDDETSAGGPAMVAADQRLSVSVPVFAPNANIIAHRIFNVSEFFPAHMQDVALERLIDQHVLFNTPQLTERSVDILAKYGVQFVIVETGSRLDLQYRMATQWFEWLMDDTEYSLYAVRATPSVTESIQGNTALVARDLEAAEALYRFALAQNPDDPLATVGLVTVYRDGGRFDEAIARMEGLAARQPSATVYYHLGRLLSDAGRVGESIGIFEQAIEAAPNVARYHLALGNSCLRAEDEACAQAAYKQAFGLDPSYSEATRLLLEADLWRQRGRSDLALPLYEDLVEISPSASNRLVLASVYQTQERYEDAAAVLQELRREDPLDPEFVAREAGLHATQGDIDGAIELYQHAVWLLDLRAADSSLTRLSLISLLIDDGRTTEAEDAILRILYDQPWNATAYLLLGDLWREQGRPEQAVEAFRQVLTLDPTVVTAYTSLREQYQQQAALDENLDLLINATTLNPEQPSLYLSLAEQFEELGDPQSAAVAYKIAADLLENAAVSPRLSQVSIDSSRSLAYSRLATLTEDQGQVQTAMGFYNAAVAALPTDPEVRVQVGDALRRRNQPELAEAAYRKAIELDANYLLAYLQLADLQRAQGEIAVAESTYEQALEVFLNQPEQNPRAISRLALEGLGGFYFGTEALLGSVGEIDNPGSNVLDPLNQLSLAPYIEALQESQTTSSQEALASLYQLSGQPQNAIDLYQQLIDAAEEAETSGTEISRYYTEMGELLMGIGQFPQASLAFESAIRLDRQSLPARLGLARAYTALGNTSRALEQIQQAIEFSPGSLDAQLALASTLSERGDVEAAIQLFEEAYQSRPGNVRAALAVAQAMELAGDWEEAEHYYDQAIETAPGSVDAYLGLASLYRGQARFDEAESMLQQALRVDRAAPSVYLLMGSIYYRQLRYAEAIEAYEGALAVDPANERAYVGLADVYRSQGEVGRAIGVLNDAVEVNSGAIDPLLELASLYREQAEIGAAEAALEAALERAPGSVTVRFVLAELYRSQARGEAALEQLRLAVEERPTSMEALVRYGDGLRERGQVAEAELLYERALTEGEATTVGYRLLAGAREAQGRLEEALALLQAGLEVGANDVLTWLQLGRLQLAMGDVSGGLASLEQATVIGPAEGRAWQGLGEGLLTLGRREEAVAALERGLAVEPTYLPTYGTLIEAHPFAEQSERVGEIVAAVQAAVPGSYLGGVYAARYLQDQLEVDAAIAALEGSIELAPGEAESYLALGTLLARQARYGEAIEAYEGALAVDPANERAYRGLEVVYRAMGRAEETIGVLTRSAYIVAILTAEERLDTDRTTVGPQTTTLAAKNRTARRAMLCADVDFAAGQRRSIGERRLCAP